MATLETDPLVCVNSDCRKNIEQGTKYCPYCRTPQGATSKSKGKSEEEFYASFTSWDHQETNQNSPVPGQYVDEKGIVLRASNQIWTFTETEESVHIGRRRPLLVIDENTVHLSHTDRTLGIEELLNRVQQIIFANDVPVRVMLEDARWQSDRSEARPRIIAFLKDHAYSDFKMIFGVDYMGKWASIKMCLAVEPPIIPPIKADSVTMKFRPIFSIVIFVIAAFVLTVLEYNYGYSMITIGVFLIIIGIFVLVSEAKMFAKAKKDHQEKRQQKIDKQKEEIEKQAQTKLLYRTHKIDDMRLFASAMNVVFQTVVDDIVEKDGGKVERIEGGKGGFFTEDGLTTMVAAPRKSDVAALGL